MIGPGELEDALSRHLARVLVNQCAGQKAMAVDGADHGIDLEAAAALGHRYAESYLYDMSGRDMAAAAFAAGCIVGRTAREAEVTVPEVSS